MDQLSRNMGTLLAEPGGLAGPRVGGELAFSLDEPAFSSDHFRMYDFKVKRCPRARPHDWTACPFAHPGEKAKRRDPRRYRYSGTACPDFRKTGVCRRGDACPYSHGVFECWLHPSRYRTQMCTDGPSCRRRVCFFAHYEHELRRAEEYPPLLNQQLHAGLVAEARALQQQQLAQALSGILGAGSVPSGLASSGPSANLEPLMSVQLLKTLQQQTPAALLGVATGADSSAPTTPTGMAGLSPNSVAASALQHDSSNLLLQLQLMQQQQAAGQALVAGALHTTLSDASQHSGSSPGGSPRMVAGGGIDADAARLGSPTMVPAADEASQLARLIQQQQAAAAATAAAAGSIDPALLAALQNLGLGAAAAAGVPEGIDIAGSLARRSIDNSALTRQVAPAGGVADNYLAAAAAALASGQAVGSLGAAGMPGTGSLPSQSFMSAAAALAARAGSGQPSSPTVTEEDRGLSLEQ
jgi:hypothetical protein